MGPWARALLAALGGAETGLEVEELRIDRSLARASVAGCTVTLSAPAIRPRLWAAIVSYARGRGPLERAVRGELQSEHLVQVLEQDWEESLVPAADAIVRVCSCDAGDGCEHVRAAGLAFARAVDEDPALLLRWRGAAEEREPETGDDPWRGGTLPDLPEPSGRPPESVPKRFGTSGVRVGDEDLVEVLVRAYGAF